MEYSWLVYLALLAMVVVIIAAASGGGHVSSGKPNIAEDLIRKKNTEYARASLKYRQLY